MDSYNRESFIRIGNFWECGTVTITWRLKCDSLLPKLRSTTSPSFSGCKPLSKIRTLTPNSNSLWWRLVAGLRAALGALLGKDSTGVAGQGWVTSFIYTISVALSFFSEFDNSLKCWGLSPASPVNPYPV